MSKIQEIKSYTPPILHTGKDWYIDFYAFNPVDGVMKRKKIKLNFIKSVKERRAYAKGCINRLSEKLATGWNPWIEQECGNAFLLFKDVIDKYRTFLAKMQRDGRYRQETIKSYSSYLRNMDYLKNHNPYMLLASYILYYCFIRPAEMVGLRLNDISLKKQTIFVSDNISKNRKDGTITLPSKVIHLMLDLHIFNNPGDYYLFSDGFRPGKTKRSEKMFRDWWAHHLRKDLKLSAQYKFYSLKDTGITNMLRHYDVLSVRDQARHSSILMTDIYTPHDIQEANDLIKNYQGDF